MAKLIAHRVKGNPYLVLIYRDLHGCRHQKSLGRLPEEEAVGLREKGGEEVTEYEERRLIQGAATWADIQRYREEMKEKKEREKYYAELCDKKQYMLVRFLRHAQSMELLRKVVE